MPTSSNAYYTIANPNCLIGAGNYVDAGKITATANSLNPLFLLSNAQIANTYTFARIDNLGTDETQSNPFSGVHTSVMCDFGTQQAVGLIALLKTNLSAQAKVRAMAYSDATLATTVFDSGWLPANGASPDYGLLAWGAFTWGDVDTDQNLANFNRHTFIPLVPVAAQVVVLFIDDPQVVPGLGTANGFIQFARFWVSNSYQPSFNVSYGAEIVPIDETIVTQAQAGNRMYGTPIRRRQANVTFDSLPISEVVYNILGPLFLKGGLSGEIIIMVTPADLYTLNYQSVYGNVPTVDKAVHESAGRMNSTLSVEEQP